MYDYTNLIKQRNLAVSQTCKKYIDRNQGCRIFDFKNLGFYVFKNLKASKVKIFGFLWLKSEVQNLVFFRLFLFGLIKVIFKFVGIVICAFGRLEKGVRDVLHVKNLFFF
jgi:hypothetical protein